MISSPFFTNNRPFKRFYGFFLITRIFYQFQSMAYTEHLELRHCLVFTDLVTNVSEMNPLHLPLIQHGCCYRYLKLAVVLKNASTDNP